MNNTLPEYIVVPGAVKLRNFCIGVGVAAGLFAYGALSNGRAGAMLLFGAVSIGLFIGASKIKTRKYLKVKTGLYDY